MRLRNQTLDHFQSSGSSEDRVARLILADFELYLIFLRYANVGRIGNHEIERAGIESLQQVSFMEVHAVLELMAGRVGAGDFQSCRGNLRGVDFYLR